ncbi:MAG: hypothetical protein M0Z75_12840, partial [Nitrospiraceae bacterium]|nr:hypothetical protein [Nitrospiraceae bacterium]
MDGRGLLLKNLKNDAVWPNLLLTKKSGKPAREFLNIFNFAFPNHEHTPAKRMEFIHILFIALLIFCQFGCPIFNPGFGNMRIDASGVLVPETTPHFDDALKPGEYNV